MEVVSHITDVLSKNYASIVSVGSFILIALSKLVPNSSAGSVMQKVQGAVDLVAKALVSIGALLAKLSSLLGDLIKSDGILGKK